MKGHTSKHHERKDYADGHHAHRKGRKTGGVVIKDEAPHEVYAGKGSNVEHEADDKSEGFKRGGKAKKHMGKVHGEHSMHHAGRKPRKAGGSVISSAGPGKPRSPSSHY